MEDGVVHPALLAICACVVMSVAFENQGGRSKLNALESPRQCHVCVIVHPIGTEIEPGSGLRDAGTESLLGILDTQPAILAYKRTMDVVNVLGKLAVAERRVEDHNGATVHDEANLPPERMV